MLTQFEILRLRTQLVSEEHDAAHAQAAELYRELEQLRATVDRVHAAYQAASRQENRLFWQWFHAHQRVLHYPPIYYQKPVVQYPLLRINQ